MTARPARIGGIVAPARLRRLGGRVTTRRDSRRTVDADTIYRWASCTKTFTGIAVPQLGDRGKLRLDQPIVELVPALREVHDPFGPIDVITGQHLLTHSADGARRPPPRRCGRSGSVCRLPLATANCSSTASDSGRAG